MPRAFSQLTFTPAVRAHQERLGSARSYAKFIEGGPQQGHEIGPAEQAFIEARDGFYQATVSEIGWPYVQYRGGPAGFLRVLGPRTIGYADLSGNRQYISRGNLDGNSRVALILMDYANQRRLKILGRMKFTEGPEAAASLLPDGQTHPAERAAIISVEGLDWNCPQHITPRYTEAELAPHLNALGAELAQLRAENEQLKQQLSEQD
ncbi:pyridoxamine 5'-phosphate oxidase family protein [Ruegeria pomeroyi]|nr:pyridoxamine 5'-phosphate oxidase family protein [Ruegeria pomeroyi]MCE8523006.1 pyridoxamine 5'-phosphate oxidase family protein [Ruegeria pomeroyi]MCE8525547.1 pyridoxamine 5'-phosphate oxidase family protein [Ruegeria pomeroyi]MCE8531110.1 pyridoxamine 5'-phosphate oxidase family protein [Ruegeria pomeroyi]MCE8535449.1 pyridoxamine 5'-phosphate oxidase family protein [Ruegeria pomeroyi]